MSLNPMLIKRAIVLLLVAFTLLPASSLAQTFRRGEAPPEKVKPDTQCDVIFKNKKKWAADIVGRTSSNTLKMRRQGQSGVIEYPIKDIAAIKWNTEIDEIEVLQNYDRGEYKLVIETVTEATADMMRYSDIPNNLNKLLILIPRGLYWDKQYDQLIKTATDIMRPLRVVKGDIYDECNLLKILALQGLGKTGEADAALKKTEPLTRHDKLAPLYWYAMAKSHLNANNLKEAHENVAQMVAFSGKEFDWLPPALWLSVEQQIATTNFPVALQIIDELDIVAQNTEWAVKAATQQPRVKQMDEEHKRFLAEERARLVAERNKDPRKIKKTPTLLD